LAIADRDDSPAGSTQTDVVVPEPLLMAFLHLHYSL
jgi:hypothetical protein